MTKYNCVIIKSFIIEKIFSYPYKLMLLGSHCFFKTFNIQIFL